MIDPLLYEYGVSIEVIQKRVSSIMDVDITWMLASNKTPAARKRELVIARQISMRLSRDYTTKSLSTIGNAHGGRDHATVLSACKVINNSMDTNDPLVTIPYLRAKKSIEMFLEVQKEMREVTQENTIINTEK